MKRERQRTPTEGRSQFEQAMADIEDLKHQIQRNDARCEALFERLKARYRALEKFEAKARERVANRRTP